MKAVSTPFAVAALLLLLLLLLRVHGRSFLQVEFDPLERIAHHGRPPQSSFMDTSPWEEEEEELTLDNHHSPVLADLEEEGSLESDRISLLPGQPGRVDFDQYAGYVTVDRNAGRALFYYFAEAPGSSSASSTPLVLWLNGGPGCSSFGNGAMLELGPFRVEKDGKSLRRNVYSWNSAANVLFLESPAGVGFSYSNTTTDYSSSGDRRTAQDNYAFLVNWLERFPQYKARDLYIAGESYAGHYIPQLAHKILRNNKLGNHTVINLRGIAMGNAYVEDETGDRGMMDFLWMRDLISDEVHRGITSNCNYSASEQSEACSSYVAKAYSSIHGINIYNIYAPLCSHDSPHSSPEDQGFDPCSDDYVRAYLNNPQVQKALHAKATSWSSCSVGINGYWRDTPSTMLPTIQSLMASGLRIWFYSGDIDGRVPITATKYFIEKVKPLEEITPWYPWHSHGEVGGYAVAYKEGLALVTVRGAGHLVPSYQPARALTMFTSFLEGKLPPAS